MTKERLRRYGSVAQELKTISNQIETISARMEGLSSPQLTGLPSGGHKDTDRISELLDRLSELRAMYCAKLIELAEEQRAIEQAIDSLEPRERTLCRLRYIDGMPWERICCEIHLEWAQTHRLHRRALEELARL